VRVPFLYQKTLHKNMPATSSLGRVQNVVRRYRPNIEIMDIFFGLFLSAPRVRTTATDMPQHLFKYLFVTECLYPSRTKKHLQKKCLLNWNWVAFQNVVHRFRPNIEIIVIFVRLVLSAHWFKATGAEVPQYCLNTHFSWGAYTLPVPKNALQKHACYIESGSRSKCSA
jgi:hypothetical protein